jgi:hypothetical protein
MENSASIKMIIEQYETNILVTLMFVIASSSYYLIDMTQLGIA